MYQSVTRVTSARWDGWLHEFTRQLTAGPRSTGIAVTGLMYTPCRISTPTYKNVECTARRSASTAIIFGRALSMPDISVVVLVLRPAFIQWIGPFTESGTNYLSKQPAAECEAAWFKKNAAVSRPGLVIFLVQFATVRIEFTVWASDRLSKQPSSFLSSCSSAVTIRKWDQSHHPNRSTIRL